MQADGNFVQSDRYLVLLDNSVLKTEGLGLCVLSFLVLRLYGLW